VPRYPTSERTRVFVAADFTPVSLAEQRTAADASNRHCTAQAGVVERE
jgi:hypothetical protein